MKRQKYGGVLFLSAALVFFYSGCVQPEFSPGLYAKLNTNKGLIVLELAFEKTPMTVANFVGLAEGTIENDALPLGTPYFDGTEFNRVVPGHVIQAGIPRDAESRGPGYTFPNEIHTELGHGRAGMLGMANYGPHTNGSQFYITLGDRSYLDGDYTVFGRVHEGLDVVADIVQGDKIDSIRIVRIGREAKRFASDTQAFLAFVEKAKKRVIEEQEAKDSREATLIESNWPEAVTTETGLKYIVMEEGTGQKPDSGSTLTALYSGNTLTGDKTFVSDAQGLPSPQAEPAAFPLSGDITRIIPAITEALADMNMGEKRILIIPSSLGFGTSGYYARPAEGQKRFVISPNTTLVIELTLLRIE